MYFSYDLVSEKELDPYFLVAVWPHYGAI